MSVRSVLSKVRTWIGWGVSDNDLTDLEGTSAWDGPVDFVRIYGWLGKLPTGVEALASTRQVVVSLKFRDANGATIPAANITAGQWNTQLGAAFAWFNALPQTGNGPHVLIFEHEEDAQAAAGSGTPAQLNASFDFCAAAARKSAGWQGLIGCCVTGYQPATREPLYAASFAASDVVTVDQPYTNGAPPWASADSIVGPAVDWFTANYPTKPILITEWGATASPASSPSARADWIAAFAKALVGPRYANVAGVIYWNATTGSFDTRLSTPADIAAWSAAGKSLIPPPAPAMVSVAAAEVSALSAAMAALAASGSALSSAQASFVAAQADYASKLSAATAAAKAVTG